MMNKPQKISQKIVAQNKYLKILEKVFSDDKNQQSSFLITSLNRDQSRYNDFTNHQNGEILYLKEFRYWPEKFVINFPSWMLDDGISEIENCEKELFEEIGYKAESIEFLTKVL